MSTRTPLFRRQSTLRELLSGVPNLPGIYRFYDAADRLVYVGKSVSLRDRVRSYFTGDPPTAKLRRMRLEVVQFDWELTGSELEALLLESRLIKQHQPRFNVLLKGFVPLPFVRVDWSDPFPRLEVTREPQRDGKTYYGPFHRREVLESAVRALSDTLGLRDCELPGRSLRGTPSCHRYDLGFCTGPCLGNIEEASYKEAARTACEVFEGRDQEALAVLRERMHRAAERLRFEQAGRLRDALIQIQGIAGRQQAILSAVEELSLIAVCPSRSNDRLVGFVFRNGRFVGQIDLARDDLIRQDGRMALAGLLLDVYGAADSVGGMALNSALLDEVQIISAWMRQKTREGQTWVFPRDATPNSMLSGLNRFLESLISEALPDRRESAA